MGPLTSPFSESLCLCDSVFWGRAKWWGGGTRLVTPMPQMGRSRSKGLRTGARAGLLWSRCARPHAAAVSPRLLSARPPGLHCPACPSVPSPYLPLSSASILPPASGLSPPVTRPVHPSLSFPCGFLLLSGTSSPSPGVSWPGSHSFPANHLSGLCD